MKSQTNYKKILSIILLAVMLVMLVTVPVSAQSPDPGGPSLPSIELTPDFLTMVLAGIVAAVFAYFPGLRTWFAGLSAELKSTIMIGMLLLLTILIVIGSCAKWFVVPGFMCEQPSFIQAGWIFIQAVIANQSLHRILPETNDVRQAKAERDIDLSAHYYVNNTSFEGGK